MKKVSIEVRNRVTRFSVAVQAESIERAVSLVGGLHPKSVIRVKLPIAPQGFSVKLSAARAEPIGYEPQELIAA